MSAHDLPQYGEGDGVHRLGVSESALREAQIPERRAHHGVLLAVPLDLTLPHVYDYHRLCACGYLSPRLTSAREALAHVCPIAAAEAERDRLRRLYGSVLHDVTTIRIPLQSAHLEMAGEDSREGVR